MCDHEERLRYAMEEHEYLAPDQATVWARIELLAQIYRRRSLILRSAGSVVLSAGLVAGLVQMHTFIQGGVAALPPAATPSAAVPQSPAATTRPPAPRIAPTRSPPPAPGELEMDAYFEAGYGWTEAEELARLWRFRDPSDAKVEGGRRLLAGERLPIRPSS
ncbi:hypothetical protein [Paractinoplanes hotanensis]|uniref:Uncharacterized protein n=1 Tax=Paractinoplanes hotanensis TaxID=2906497 RepID=A0ABT0Y9U1_9ACTN|nr:hypothetical protein [Actinoplanes hotanensis]MCM4082822.1 hypothetical protein [Actinoplanes hotanensis]